MSGQRRATKARGLLHYIGVGLSVGLLAFVLLVGVMVIVVPAATGSTPMTVLTSSMEPTYPAGTLIIVRPIDPQEIVIGDPITYQIESGKSAVVTHRVVSITSISDGTFTFTTKGDNNDAADPNPVLPVQVKGKVWYSVPWIGYLNNLIGGENRGWIVPAIAIALFIYAGYMVASSLVGAARRRRRREAAAERAAAPRTTADEQANAARYAPPAEDRSTLVP